MYDACISDRIMYMTRIRPIKLPRDGKLSRDNLERLYKAIRPIVRDSIIKRPGKRLSAKKLHVHVARLLAYRPSPQLIQCIRVLMARFHGAFLERRHYLDVELTLTPYND